MAVKIAKDGDKIFVKSGTYTSSQTSPFEIKKFVQIYGEGHGKTIFNGPWLIQADAGFTNVKFAIDEDEKDAIYVTNSALVRFEFCHFAIPNNTGIYVLNDQEFGTTQIELYGCVCSGFSESARFLSLGNCTSCKISYSYLQNFHSFCTVIDHYLESNISLEIITCYFEDVQDAIKFMVHPSSDIKVKIDRLKLELDLIDPEAPSTGIYTNAGTSFDLRNVVIEGNHADFVGISLNNLESVHIENSYISGSMENIEETSIGKGISMQNVSKVYLRNICTKYLR